MLVARDNHFYHHYDDDDLVVAHSCTYATYEYQRRRLLVNVRVFPFAFRDTNSSAVSMLPNSPLARLPNNSLLPLEQADNAAAPPLYLLVFYYC